MDLSITTNNKLWKVKVSKQFIQLIEMTATMDEISEQIIIKELIELMTEELIRRVE